jgi:integrase
MDTGRRPAEICQLGWDCLDQDPDGKYALVYTDFKANRQGRRLPVADEGAAVIADQQQRVRACYPDTPASELTLFPRTTRNREGKRPVSDSVVASHHRSWVSSLRRTAAMLAHACGHLFWPHAKYAGQAEQASYARRLTEQLQGDRSPG